jgi:hypothetical protein
MLRPETKRTPNDADDTVRAPGSDTRIDADAAGAADATAAFRHGPSLPVRATTR